MNEFLITIQIHDPDKTFAQLTVEANHEDEAVQKAANSYSFVLNQFLQEGRRPDFLLASGKVRQYSDLKE